MSAKNGLACSACGSKTKVTDSRPDAGVLSASRRVAVSDPARCGHCNGTNSLILNAEDPYCLLCGHVAVEVPDFIMDEIDRYAHGDRRALMPPHYRGIAL